MTQKKERQGANPIMPKKKKTNEISVSIVK